jgi:eukaryotic-like serine/threonine-protein kinase
MAFEPGQTVGEYEVLNVLSTGGMGRVYRVRNVISNRVEAMKVLLPDFAAEPDLAARFIAEIRTLASLDHPNIAQFHTAFQVDNQLVMMMEFVEGFTLEQRAKQGPIPQDEVIEYALQVLSALSYAHGRGVVHRDIKPANIMVTSHGVVKLMDFGIAKSGTEVQLTQPGTTLGSVYYMSPEQVRGGTVDARSDLYSVGILLYELLSGHRPFEADNTYNILDQQLNALPRPPVELNPLLPKPLSDLILLALAKDSSQRFQSADAFRNALCSTVGKGPSLSAPPVSSRAPTATNVAAVASLPSRPAAPPPGAAASTPPQNSGGPRRATWVAIGALTVVALLAAAAVGVPHFFSAGATSKSASLATQSPAASTATPATGSGSTVTPAASPDQPPTPSPTPSPEPSPAPSPAVNQPQPAERPVAHPHAHPRYSPPHSESPPAVQNALPTPVETAPPTPVQPPAGPSPEEIEQARDRKIQLDSRASVVSASLDSLQRQQQAGGFGLRQDIAAASIRMRTYMQAAAQDLDNGNIAAAQHDMDRADKEISTLEAFFNR